MNHRAARTRERRGALLAVVLVAAILYVAKPVAVPLALAVLLTFLLNPVVGALERRGVGPLISVLLVVALAFGAMGATAIVIGGQLYSLSRELPRYRGNIGAKIAEWKGVQGDSSVGRLQRLAEEVVGEIEKPVPGGGGDPAARPVPVVVTPPSWLWRLPSLIESVASASLVLVLVVFMLLRRKELRNRIVRLFGFERLALTTKALDEAGERITGYLVRQSIINGCFGALVGLGLLLIGLPYAVVWGLLAGLLRFIPYAGPWIAAALPTLVGLAVFPGWWQPVAVIGLIAVLELTIYLAIEPWVYGRGAGVSEVALLAAVAFWTWLWGPIGLVMATPLTVCLVVLGKYVPSLEPVAMLLSDEPVMPPGPLYYQRLVAGDEHEAERVANAYLEARDLGAVFDDLMAPALGRARGDLEDGTLSPDDEEFAREATRRIAYRLAGVPMPPADATATEADAQASRAPTVAGAPPTARTQVVGCPARTPSDEAALELVALLLAPAGYRLVIAGSGLLVSETLAVIGHEEPAAVCVVTVDRAGLVYARYLIKRLAAQAEERPVVVGAFGLGRRARTVQDRLLAAGAEHAGATPTSAALQVTQLVQHALAREDASAVPAEGPEARYRAGSPTAARR